MIINLIKEEDFVANLYNRRLLTYCELPEIDKELNEAIVYLAKDTTIIEKGLKDAIIGRLELRRKLLSAVKLGELVDPHKGPIWSRCSELLPALISTTKLGTPVERSFSTKIQRRLASSVPPRPIVKISFHDALASLTKLCQYSKEAYQILDYHGGPHLLVRSSFLLTLILR